MAVDESLPDRQRIKQERDAVVAARLAYSGGGPQPPGMDARVTALENAFTDMRTTLARIDERTASLATAADVERVTGAVSGLSERVSAQGQRLSTVEDTLKNTVGVALSKTLGLGGGITLFGSMVAIVAVGVTALHYLKVL